MSNTYLEATKNSLSGFKGKVFVSNTLLDSNKVWIRGTAAIIDAIVSERDKEVIFDPEMELKYPILYATCFHNDGADNICEGQKDIGLIQEEDFEQTKMCGEARLKEW